MALLGFIGTGNMGGALARAAALSVPAEEICLCNRTPQKAAALAEELGAKTAGSRETAADSRYLFLGVKPQGMAALLEEIRPELEARRDRFLLVTMAAGLSIERLQELAGGAYPVIRIMPNTPVSVGEGVILMSCSPQVMEEEAEEFCRILSGAGSMYRMEEKLIDAGSAVSGCGPAFVDMFIDAMADGGVLCGLPRALAVQLAAQTAAGSAKLLLESGKTPAQLKEAVCSPGGTTIEGVRKLEERAMRSAVMEAVIASWEKNSRL